MSRLKFLLPLLSSVFFAGGILFARTYTLANFDDISGSPFSYKDEKGTDFRVHTERMEPDRGKILALEYDVVKDGWAGWGLAMNSMNVADYAQLTFYVRGAGGGEKFEIALKDTSG